MITPALCSLLGLVPWQIHRHRFLAALLQTHFEQTSGSQRPGVNRPGILQLSDLDQVSVRIKTP